MASVEMEPSGKALLLCEEDDDDQKKLQNQFLPLDLVLLAIAHLPSRQLFDLRRLCKAARRVALLALARRPFFIIQEKSPSPLCHLLPLDGPCSPLPCSFNLAKPSFRLFSGSGSLVCLHRQYVLLLDVCVCDIMRKWKIVLPPIVHPSFAPHIIRRIFSEDVSVGDMTVIGFHAAQSTMGSDEEGVFSPVYRVFAASLTCLRVFNSSMNQWSSPVDFPPHLVLPAKSKPPLGFATSDGNLILTFPYKERVQFFYEDRCFRSMELDCPHPEFEIAGYPASAEVDSDFYLRVRLPHIEECERSSRKRGLMLKGLCERDADPVECGCYLVTMDGVHHEHVYSRDMLQSFCHEYQGKVYALVMERNEMHCFTEERKQQTEEPQQYSEAALGDLDDDLELDDPSILRERIDESEDGFTSTKLEGNQWHDLHSLDVKKCLLPEEGATFICADFFPARSRRKLTLYSAQIDINDWTMRVSKEAEASDCPDVFDKEASKLSFIRGYIHANFG